jgi:hypothetical protein
LLRIFYASEKLLIRLFCFVMRLILFVVSFFFPQVTCSFHNSLIDSKRCWFLFVLFVQVNPKAAESLADPSEYPNLFEDWQVALAVEANLALKRCLFAVFYSFKHILFSSI